jgi:hypothetical protein
MKMMNFDISIGRGSQVVVVLTDLPLPKGLGGDGYVG